MDRQVIAEHIVTELNDVLYYKLETIRLLSIKYFQKGKEVRESINLLV